MKEVIKQLLRTNYCASGGMSTWSVQCCVCKVTGSTDCTSTKTHQIINKIRH